MTLCEQEKPMKKIQTLFCVQLSWVTSSFFEYLINFSNVGPKENENYKQKTYCINVCVLSNLYLQT